ncbi:hypothetical protein BD779DRAFT_253761 [Infundibulicybe gibba]|nr:hypothetical protein BD779DRAFT_253761 [Infundibulicybe gibba]
MVTILASNGPRDSLWHPSSKYGDTERSKSSRDHDPGGTACVSKRPTLTVTGVVQLTIPRLFTFVLPLTEPVSHSLNPIDQACSTPSTCIHKYYPLPQLLPNPSTLPYTTSHYIHYSATKVSLGLRFVHNSKPSQTAMPIMPLDSAPSLFPTHIHSDLLHLHLHCRLHDHP